MKNKKKRKYSANEIRAYWIGVGLSASRTDFSNLLDSKNPRIQKAIRKGYSDDNSKDISRRFK